MEPHHAAPVWSIIRLLFAGVGLHGIYPLRLGHALNQRNTGLGLIVKPHIYITAHAHLALRDGYRAGQGAQPDVEVAFVGVRHIHDTRQTGMVNFMQLAAHQAEVQHRVNWITGDVGPARVQVGHADDWSHHRACWIASAN
jgi:hypothetical protein